MNVTVGILALVMGGWVLPGGEMSDLDQPPLTQQRRDTQVRRPSATTQGNRASASATTGTSTTTSPLPQFVPSGTPTGPAGPPLGSGPTGGEQRPMLAPNPRQATGQPLSIPLPPTDPQAASDTYPWAPPTAGPSEEDLTAGGRPTLPPRGMATGGAHHPGSRGSLGAASSSLPGAMGLGTTSYQLPSPSRPAYRPGAANVGQSAFAAQLAREQAAEAPLSTSVRSPAANVVKPFSAYRPPPTVSPYMNLFRRDTGVGVDNYNSLVRPELEAMQERQQLSSQVGGLQNTARRQGTAIRNLGQQTRRLQRVPGTDYFMNHGGYFPSAGR